LKYRGFLFWCDFFRLCHFCFRFQFEILFPGLIIFIETVSGKPFTVSF